MSLRSHLVVWVLAGSAAGILPLRAQTCSCAGAPLLSMQSTGASSSGNLLAGLSYEYNDISSTFAGRRALDDATSTRSTQSLLLEVNYGLTDRLSVSATVTFVSKDRTTGLGVARSPTTLSTRGFGDGLLLVRYVVRRQDLWNPYHLAVGGGVKVPTGASSLTRSGLPLNADMQPGTGAWDGVLWSYASAALRRSTPLHLFWQNSYRHTGAGERFGRTDRYRFGSEWISTLGVNAGLGPRVSAAVQLRYRAARSDERNAIALPNTGGRWLNAAPALDVVLTDLLSTRLTGRIPLWRYLQGTQPTTTFAVGLSLFVNLNLRDDGFIHGDPR